MKLRASLIVGGLLHLTLKAETLFGPGSVVINTNEAVLINTMSMDSDSGYFSFFIDGKDFSQDLGHDFGNGPQYAIAGPHTVTITNATLVTFQRVQGSAVQTIILPPDSTNMINLPSGKTIQFFDALPSNRSISVQIKSPSSTNNYSIFGGGFGSYNHPVLSGPATLSIINPYGTPYALVSYYFTDQVLQLPPQGFLAVPAPRSEIDIQKSYDLINWQPIGAFNTSSENGAFFRLHILK